MHGSNKLKLGKLQDEFLQHLLENESSIAENIATQGKVEVSTRLGIYGNAYKLRLKDAIENDHEILGLYLGDDLFDLMAAGYIQSRPSHYTSLRDFSEHLPAYLKDTEPFSNTPIISEIAAFERSLLFAFDAANANSATMENLISTPQEQWPELKLRFHPSMQIFQSNWNAVQSWQALKAEKAPPVQEEESAYWLIWRNHERITEFRSLPVDEHAMLSGFLHGQNFAEVCELLLEHHTEEEVAQNALQYIVAWLEIGVVTGFGLRE